MLSEKEIFDWKYKGYLVNNILSQNDVDEINKELNNLRIQRNKKDSDNSWTVDISEIDTNTYDLGVRNPNAAGPVELGTPQEILEEIKTLDARATTLLAELSEMLK